MKKRMLFAMLMIASAVCIAQTDDNAFNDSTEYVFQPKTVIDTVKVTAEAKAYISKEVVKLEATKDSLRKEMKVLGEIINIGEKEKLTEEHGTLSLYAQLYNELKGDGVRRMKFIYHGTQGNWPLQFSKEQSKIEKELTKKQRPHPLVVQYVQWLYKQDEDAVAECSTRQENLEKQDVFNVYRQHVTGVKSGLQYPQREILVKVKNEYYRPALMLPYYNDGKLDKIDERLQKRGWEWLDKDKHTSVSESYPVSYSYQKYESHPEYKVVYVGYSVPCVFDANGKLVRVPSMSHGFVSDHIKKILLNLDYRKDYADNKYDIKKENKDVQYVIVNKLGLSRDNEARMSGAMTKAYGAAFNAEYGNLSQRIKAGQQKKDAEKAFLQQIFRMMNDTADRFLEQLKKDHEGDYNYIYKIERLTDVSFKIYFVTKDVKPRCNVVVTFHSTEPYKCDWQIDDISRY